MSYSEKTIFFAFSFSGYLNIKKLFFLSDKSMWEPVYSIDDKFTSRYGDEKHDLADV